MPRQAILTKYHGPTNNTQSRISARADAGRLFVNYRCELSVTENHNLAAMTLARKFGWSGPYYSGGLPKNEGNVYVWALGEDKVLP